MKDDKGRFTSKDELSLQEDESQELLELYLNSLKQQKGSKESTLETRRREVRYWLAFCERNNIEPLSAVTDDVHAYIQFKSNKSDTTRDNYYRSVQSFYTICENDQLYSELELENGHPCRDKRDIDMRNTYNVYGDAAAYQIENKKIDSDIDIAREKSKKSNVLAIKPEKIKLLFDNVPGKKHSTKLRNEIAVRLNWYTACRSDELSRMRLNNIDWDNCTIRIRSAKLNHKEHRDLYHREVVFPEEFKYQLKRWCYRIRPTFSSEVSIPEDGSDPDNGFILVTENSESMTPSSINDIVKQSAFNAGIQTPLRPPDVDPDSDNVKEWLVTTHRIRRSAISHWVNDCSELDTVDVKNIAGHAKLSQTMSYVEPDSEKMIESYHRAMG